MTPRAKRFSPGGWLTAAVAAVALVLVLVLALLWGRGRARVRERFQPGNLSSAVVTLYSRSAPPKDYSFDLGAYAGDRGRLLARAKGALDDAATTTDEAKRVARQLEVLALAAAAGEPPEFSALVAAVRDGLARNGQHAVAKKTPAPPMLATDRVRAPLVQVPVCATARHPPAAVYGTINAPLAHLADRGYVAWS